MQQVHGGGGDPDWEADGRNVPESRAREGIVPLQGAPHCSTLLHTAPHTALICISLKNTFFFTSKVSVQKKLQDFSKLSVDPNQRLEMF